MKFSFINLGCKINQIEMEQASQGLVSLGYQFTEDTGESDFLLINTCTVTAKADKKSLQTIRKYSQLERLKHVFVTGCYSELEPELASKVHPKNLIVAQKDKQKMPEIIDTLLKEDYGPDIVAPLPLSSHIAAGDRFSAFKLARVSDQSMGNEQVNFFKHTRAFIKIQDGCNAFCSYCRIPYARGAPVSRNYVNILEHVKRLRQNGIREIVLSGINIGKYYDSENQISFSQLLKDILEQLNDNSDVRVKISSIEPFSLDEDFFSCIGHPNLAPHIHLPLQGLSDDILLRMNRRYRLNDYRDIVNRIYQLRPDFSIATDVIVGYPGESEEDYEAGKRFLWDCGISKIHVFPFSSRPFTKDFLSIKGGKKETEKDLSGKVKKYRSRDLRKFSRELESHYLKRVMDQEQSIILENQVDNLPSHFIGISGAFQEIWYQGTTEYNLKGIVPVTPETVSPNTTNQVKRKDIYQESQNRYKGKCLTVKLTHSNPLIFHPVG